MDLDTLRRHRGAIGAVLLLLVVWLGAGVRRAGGQGVGVVLDSPLGLIAPRVVAPGWHLALPGLLRISSYPTSAVAHSFDSDRGGARLVSSEGIELVVSGSLLYRVEPERLLEVHRDLGPDLESGTIAPLLERELAAIAAGARYDEISGARSDDLRIDLGKALTEQFRTRGLLLLSCEVERVRIRHGEGGEGFAARRVPGMRVLLVGLDGADWDILDPLIAAGRLPHIARLVREGARGRLQTITPMLSPVIWTSMATGVLPGRHGIVDFVATAGAGSNPVPVTSSLRKVKAFWNILSDNGLSVGVVGWWASYPAEPVSGFVVTDRVAYQLFRAPIRNEGERPGKVYPPDIDADVRSMTRHPESIGDGDLSPFIRLGDDPAALSPDDQQRVEGLRTLLAAGDSYAAITEALAGRFRPDLTAFYLEGTDTVSHLFMPFAPPPLEGTSSSARMRFGGAVDAYYRHADAMLGRLVEAVQPTVVILCSDHGFRTGDKRPLTDSRIGYAQAADWHRRYGVIVLHGEPFRRGEEIREASILDLTPTLLVLFGLPVAEDMDGRPLLAAFREEFLRSYPVRYLPTYEGETIVRLRVEDGGTATSGSTGTAPPASGGDAPVANGAGEASSETAGSAPPADPAGERALVERLRSLGYLSQDSASSHNNRGLILLGRGDYDGAIREFEQAIGDTPGGNMGRYNLARTHYMKGNVEPAEAILRDLLERQPSSKEAENLLGNIAMNRGRLAEAERHLRRALEIEPRFTDALNSLGLLHEAQGRPEEALEQFRRVIALDPEYAEAYNNLGLVHQGLGRLEESVSAFRKAIAADPGFAGSYSNLAVSYEMLGDLAAAEEQSREALRRDPGNVRVRVNYGGLLYKQGRLQEARAELEKAVETDPSDASAHNNLGAVYGRLGRRTDEIASYRQAMLLKPDYADAAHNLGFALLRDGQHEEGEKVLRGLIAAQPDYLRGYLTLGRFLLEKGEAELAVSLLEAGAKNTASDSDLQLLLAEGYLRQGKTERALAALDASLIIRPDQPEVRSRADALRMTLAPPEGSAEGGVDGSSR
jgi:tetratricopeptide (TPR) repeat protein